MLGMGEWIIILIIVIIVFGASRIPKVGEALGKGIRNFSKALKSKDDEIAENKKTDATLE
jgi:sec-independent protein translocase protein TatA